MNCTDRFILLKKISVLINHRLSPSTRQVLPCSLFILSSLAAQSALSESADSAIKINTTIVTSTNPADTLLPNGVKLGQVPYDHQEFLNYYKVLIYNGNVDFAYNVAKVAVIHEPYSILWRKNLAQSALWSGRPAVALRQWIYFIDRKIEAEHYADDALKLARQLNDYESQRKVLAFKLSKSPGNKDLLLQYTDAIQNQGYPLEAMKILQQIPGVNSDKDYLDRLVYIARGMDNQELLLHYLDLSYKNNTSSTTPALALAQYFYLEGNISAAWNVVHANASKALSSDLNYWNSYGNIALMAGHLPEAIAALNKVMSGGKLDKASTLELVSMEEVSGKNAVAYQHAVAGYQKYQDPLFIPLVLNLGENLAKWQALKDFTRALPNKELIALKSKPASAIQLVNIDAQLGLINQAYQGWMAILHRWPNHTLVQQMYTWFLIDNNQLKQLEYILKCWCNNFLHKPALWDTYVAGLMSLGDYPRALTVIMQHLPAVNKSWNHLITLGNILEQQDKPYPAYYVMKKAFHLLWKDISKDPNNISLEQSLKLVELMAKFSPAVVTTHAISRLSLQWYKSVEVDNQVLSWALQNNQFALASFIEKIHNLRAVDTPKDAALTLALLYNDHPAMAALLKNSLALLPHRDRVMAAVRLENMKLAEQLAYQGLKEHPTDSEMYDLFKEVMLPRANKWSFGSFYKNIGDVGGALQQAYGRFFLTPSISASPYSSVWTPKTTNTRVVAWVPDTDATAGVKVRKYIHRGWIQGRIGGRKSLDDFLVAGLGMERQVSSKLQSQLFLDYHQRAIETAPLELGGMKNAATLHLDYTLDSYNSFDLDAQTAQYLGQDNSSLGTGQEIQLHWQKKLALAYPDWNINLYGIWTDYQYQNKIVSAPLQRFVPIDDDPVASFFMPQRYSQIALTFGANQRLKYEYTQRWRPFFEAGFSYSWPFGLGEVAEAGLGGSVFGRDHLAIFAEYSLNQQQGSQQNLKVGMRYDNYF